MISRSLLTRVQRLQSQQLITCRSSHSLTSSTQQHKHRHRYERNYFDDSDTLKRLTHKDWLSPTEVINTFTNIQDPNNLVPAFRHYKTRKDYKPSEPLYTLIINKLAQGKMFDEIENLLQTIKAEKGHFCNFPEEFFYNLMKVYGLRGGRIRKAIDTLFEMRDFGCLPSVKSLNFVLNLLVNNRMFEFVHEVFLKGCGIGIEVDACCLNILVKGLCKSGNLGDALKVLDEFPKQGCVPNERTFSTLMHALCEKGRVDEAFRLLHRMEREGVDADAVVYNVLISGLRKQGRVDEGVELLERMKGKGCDPNPGTYQEVLYGLLDAEKFIKAREFMSRMINEGIEPSFVSYKLIVECLCEENMPEDVDWALKQMVHQGFVPSMGMWRQMLQGMSLGKSASVCASFDELVKN